MRLIILPVLLTLLNCNGRWVDGRFVEDAVVTCPGGKVDIERRTVDVIGGRTRNTVTRTNACLE